MTRTALNFFAGISLAASGLILPRAFGQLPGASQPSADTYRLHGLVLDVHTDKPISRAVVEAYNGRLAAFTDHEGRFALTLHFTPGEGGGAVSLQRGLINQGVLFLGLTARKPGYSTNPREKSYQMVALSALDQDMVLRLTPQSSIQGRIASAGDDHPEGVRVTLFIRQIQDGSARWITSGNAMTDSRGEFRFASLQPGRYRILTGDWSDSLESPGDPVQSAAAGKPVSRYAPVSYPAGTSDFKLTAGETAQVDLNLHPQTYIPVRIPVTLPVGSNPGLQARVQRPGDVDGLQSGFNLRYNARDKAVEGVLPSGSYEVALQANGPNGSAATVQLTVGGSRTETAPVTLMPLASIPVIVHQNLTNAAQPGRPDRAQGRIIAGASSRGEFAAIPAQVMLFPLQQAMQTYTALRRNGADETLIERVLPGTYRVEVNANTGYVAAATSGGTDLLRQPLIVTPGSGAEPIEVTIRDDTATLKGTLDSSLRKPPSSSGSQTASAEDALASAFPGYDPSAIVFVTCIPSEAYSQHLTQSIVLRDGTFTLANLAPGSYKVFASRVPLGNLEYRSESFQRDYGSKGYSITLEPNATASVSLTSVIESQEP